MAAVLASLEALVELVAATPDPTATMASLSLAAQKEDAVGVIAALEAPGLAEPALMSAGITARGKVLPTARDQLLRVEGILWARGLVKDSWRPVMTVPHYLRTAIAEGHVAETYSVLTELVASASDRVVIVSPYLDAGFDRLIAPLLAFLTRGGKALIITRELALPASHNAEAIRRLRAALPTDARVEVASWEEEGLGLHMKCLVADGERAYVGSANFTYGGMSQHAELGVRLEGPAVLDLEQLLEVLASELRSRRRLQAR